MQGACSGTLIFKSNTPMQASRYLDPRGSRQMDMPACPLGSLPAGMDDLPGSVSCQYTSIPLSAESPITDHKKGGLLCKLKKNQILQALEKHFQEAIA